MKKIALLCVISAAMLSACGGGDDVAPVPGAVAANAAPVPNTATASGYTLSVFAKAPSSNAKPDSIVRYNDTVFIGYQMAGDVKDGSVPNLTNTIVQYDLNGNVLKSYVVPGHVDGLMARADTNALWAMANEDGNPELTIIDLASGNQKTYLPTVNPTAHGGGFDDMQLLNGVIYVSASNPTTPGAAPTVVSLTLNPNGTTFDVAPVLAGNAQAIDVTPTVGGAANPTYNQPVTLSLTDPDSEAIDSAGDLMLDSQADGKLVFIHSPGPAQTVSVLTLTLYNDKDGPVYPVDDTRWVPASGPVGKTFMLFTDASNTTYRVDAPFKQGDAYSAGQGQVMQLDTKTGHLTPVVAGIGSASALQDPHGMLFVAL
ncbi:hypothetical protein BTI_3375 [Burkholderia thailandensis MSMB121]|uniref:hypothetical protein n=1 Tax=Burkholderia humptydooensis TaxID=430531 RepID=UPI000328086D|nr:hypothetical protein [Burkholderia humptydooensis]AGK46145.1 hypothetical protein BTI_3375 [Burkholderia thailandensis MSMB121]ATF35046.1 hypothetical protein CO709_17610 [Burkholderia thailandensis]KST75618.1 hypothetical protein WS76_16540 [Burkholderia humptydooensis]